MLEGSVLLRYRLTRDDVVALSQAARRSERRVLAGYVVLSAALVAGLLLVGLGLQVLWVVAVLTALVVRVAQVLARRRRAAVGVTFVVEFGPGGVTYDLGGQSGRLDWTGIEARVEGPVLVLARDGRSALTLPARVLSPSDLDAIAAWAGAAPAPAGTGPDAAGAGADTVAEGAGEIVVRGAIGPARARRIASGTQRSAVRRGRDAGLVLILAAFWAIALPDLRTGGGLPGVAVAVTVVTAIALLLRPLLVFLAARELATRLRGRTLEWRYSPQGVTTSSGTADSYARWDTVRDAAIKGDMLLVRRTAEQRAVGYLVGPLSAEQRRLVVGWLEAASGRRVHGAR